MTREPVDDLEALLQHRTWLRALALQLVRDPHAAEDVAQDAWVRILGDRAETRERTRAWIATIARNLARDRRKTERHRGEREELAARAEAQPGADELAERFDVHRRVVTAVHGLEEPYRSAVLLRWFEGLSPRAIARRLGVPVKTVNTRLERAHGQLRARLDRDFGGDRGAWTVLVLRAFGTAPAAGAAGGMVLVGTKAKSVVAALVVLAAGLAWWTRGAWLGGEARPEGARAEAVADHEGAPPGRADVAAPETSTGAAPREPAALVHAPPAGPHLTVRVLDLADAPRAGVRVTIGHNPVQGSDIPEAEVRDVRELLQAAETGADGLVHFAVPPRREFEALAALEGCVPQRAEKLVAGMEHVFRLGAPATVTGRVTWFDTGAPVEGALVAPAFDHHRSRFAVRTDADGRYALRGLLPPKETLFLFPPQAAPIVVQVDLPEGGEVVRDFTAGRGRVARGVVRDARTGNPISNAVVDIPSASRLPRSVTSDERGAYTFGGIVSGSTPVLRARADGYGAVLHVVLGGDEAFTLDFDLEPERTIRGRVVDASRQTLAGVFVAARCDQSNSDRFIVTPQWTITRTSGDGAFLLAGLNARDVQSVLLYGEGRGARLVGLRPEELEQRAVVLGDLELDAVGSIAGRVLDELGAPIAGATVTTELAPAEPADAGGGVRAKTLVRTARTDEAGAYALLDVPPGRHVLRAAIAQRVPPAPFTVDVPAGGELADVDVRLARPLSIRGVVYGPDGAPLPGATVIALDGWSTARPGARAAADGAFARAGLPRGRSTVQADQSLDGAGEAGRVEMTRAIVADVEAGATGVELHVPRVVRVRGRVLDARGAPIAHAEVFASRVSGGFSSQGTSDANGRFVLRCTERAKHRVVVQRTELVPGSDTQRRVEPSGTIDLELEWDCDPEQELVLRVPDRKP